MTRAAGQKLAEIVSRQVTRGIAETKPPDSSLCADHSMHIILGQNDLKKCIREMIVSVEGKEQVLISSTHRSAFL